MIGKHPTIRYREASYAGKDKVNEARHLKRAQREEKYQKYVKKVKADTELAGASASRMDLDIDDEVS